MSFSESLHLGMSWGDTFKENRTERKKRKSIEDKTGMNYEEWQVQGELDERKRKELELAAAKGANDFIQAKKTIVAGNYSPDAIAKAYNLYLPDGQTVAPVVGSETDPNVINFMPAKYKEDGSFEITADKPIATFGNQESMKQWADNIMSNGEFFMRGHLAAMENQKQLDLHKAKNEADTEQKQKEAELGLVVGAREKLDREEKLVREKLTREEKMKREELAADERRTNRTAAADETRLRMSQNKDHNEQYLNDIEAAAKDIQDVLDDEFADIKMLPNTARKVSEILYDQPRRQAVERLVGVALDEKESPERRKIAISSLQQSGLDFMLDKPDVLKRVLKIVK